MNDELQGTLTPLDRGEPTWKYDDLSLSQVQNPPLSTPTVVNPPFWTTRTVNNLFGVQIGVDGKLWELGRLSLDGQIKAGVFDNNAKQTTAVSMAKQLYTAQATTNAAAFVSEAALQAKYQLAKGLAFKLGYEALWLDGVALAPGQIRETYTTYAASERARARRQLRLERALPGRHGRARGFVLASPGLQTQGGVSMSARAKSLAFARAIAGLVRLAPAAPPRRLSWTTLLVALTAPGGALAQAQCAPTTQPPTLCSDQANLLSPFASLLNSPAGLAVLEANMQTEEAIYAGASAARRTLAAENALITYAPQSILIGAFPNNSNFYFNAAGVPTATISIPSTSRAR